MTRNKLIHFCFVALDIFGDENKGRYPNPWDKKDSAAIL